MPGLLLVALLIAEAPAAASDSGSVALHGWADVFYAFNPNRPPDGASFLPGAGTTAKRANEFDLNAAAFDVSLDPKPVGFHLTLAFGSGPEVVHAAEPALPATGPGVWRSIYQASVSYLAPIGRGVLLEAGIYPSHIGYESFFSKDNWNYTRGWMGEFSPYYQAGLKIAVPIDDHWSVQVHFLNGWQTIGDDNRAKSVGTQVAWSGERLSVAFNTFAGPELARDDSHWRLFGDLTATWKASTLLSLGTTADAGRQDLPHGAAIWHAAALYARLALHERVAIAIRAEYYDDRDGFFSGARELLRDGTATLEIHPAEHLVVKLEARQDLSDARVFAGHQTQTLALASANAFF